MPIIAVFGLNLWLNLFASTALWSYFFDRRFRSALSTFSENPTACLALEWSYWWVMWRKTILGQRGAFQSKETERRVNQRQTLQQAARCHFGDHITIEWHYLCYIYTWHASCVFVKGTMVGGSGFFQVQTKHCVQLWPKPLYSCSPASLLDGDFNNLLTEKDIAGFGK